MSGKVLAFNDFHLHGASAPEWNQRYVQLTSGTMRSSLVEANIGQVHVFRKWMSERVVQQGCVPTGNLCFGMLCGQASGTTRIQGHEVQENSLFVLRGGQEFSLQRPKGLELLAVTFRADELTRSLQDSVLGSRTTRIVSRPVLEVPLPALHRFRRELLRTFKHASHADEEASTDRLYALATLQAVLDAALDVLEASQGSDQTVGSASAAALVARSHDIIAGDVEQPLCIDTLCRRLRTSRRTLQNSFRQVSGMTPLQYLRCVRLDAVRRQLLSKSMASPTIAQVAVSSGFNHFGRFAEQYKALFGELPSQTLLTGGKDRTANYGRLPASNVEASEQLLKQKSRCYKK